MVRIELVTTIAAPIERCFDLSRSIDLHMASTDWTGERAIAGITSGLIGMDQEVTWRGRHFGVQIQHTSRITAFDPPRYFQDRMVRGAFRSFCHDHYFEFAHNTTVMTDRMEFQAPLAALGRLVEPLLERHMRMLLLRRNDCIKRTAEGNSWAQFLSSRSS
jgi:ligand-binding SRPBCC domain-containing protein